MGSRAVQNVQGRRGRKDDGLGNPPLERHEVRLRGLRRGYRAIPIAPTLLNTPPALDPDGGRIRGFRGLHIRSSA
jgi:hypothetical protein